MRPEESTISVRAVSELTVWLIDAKGFHLENTKLERYNLLL